MFEDDETLQMYIEESLDHLADIESDLLTIEEGGENIDFDLVNNVFRAAHSVKGGAGFMGLSTIKDLSHSLENVLGLIRNNELIPDSEKISVLLKGFDELENLLRNIDTSNDQDVSDHIVSLEQITKASLPEEKHDMVTEIVDIVLPDGRVFSSVSLFEIEQYKAEGKNLFLVEYDLINDIQRKDKNPIDVLNSLQKTGTIVDSRIDFESVGSLIEETVPMRIPFQVLFASIIEYDMTETLFDIDKQYIHAITDEMIETSQAPPDTEPETMPTLDQVSQQPTVEQAAPPVKEPVVVEPRTATVAAPAPEPVAAAATPAASPVKKAEPKVAATTAQKKKTAADKDINVGAKPQTSLRVNVGLLDTLMNLAGELVLSRNQLLQGINSSNSKATELSSQRIDMITSELQEAIMRTRMQPIANILNKFTRVVRDLSQQLGKSIDLIIEGKDVELDKTILESINDPLTHLVRNSVDHGIETPIEREQVGKDATGKITLKAFHDAGQVNIVISDDGKGLHPDKIADSAIAKGLVTDQQVAEMSAKNKMEMIFLPGFSTAKEVTDVSGRGVGMDVVVTNIENLGGIIELDSTPGQGTDIQIKLPLTLAIIPSQITSVGNERYAVPQVNLNELLRIPAAQVKEKIEMVGDAAVVRLRGELLPLINLSELLGIERTYVDPEENVEKPDRRQNVADRRSKHHEFTEDGYVVQTEDEDTFDREVDDRRYRSTSAMNIAVVSAGAFKYGLVVDQLYDSEEIVVKPVGRHLKKCTAYAGATIMGDGKVALILDISNLAQIAELSTISEASQVAKAAEEAEEAAKDKAALLTFRNSESEHLAAPLNLVERIERIQTDSIEQIGDRKVVQYRGGALPLYEISQVADFSPLPEREQQEVIVFKVKENELGLMVTPPVDALEVALEVDESTLKQPAISGSMIINDHTTLLVDIFELVKELNPDWFVAEAEFKAEMEADGEKIILFAEDSAFFRNQVKSFMVEEGFKVIEAEDGLIAWELLKERVDEIDIVVTDLEMPNMDGFELTSKIKTDPLYSHLQVIALTSLASEAHIEKGKKVGIDEYEIKLDREKLMKIIRQHLNMK